jgi:hypothetical protein
VATAPTAATAAATAARRDPERDKGSEGVVTDFDRRRFVAIAMAAGLVAGKGLPRDAAAQGGRAEGWGTAAVLPDDVRSRVPEELRAAFVYDADEYAILSPAVLEEERRTWTFPGIVLELAAVAYDDRADADVRSADGLRRGFVVEWSWRSNSGAGGTMAYVATYGPFPSARVVVHRTDREHRRPGEAVGGIDGAAAGLAGRNWLLETSFASNGTDRFGTAIVLPDSATSTFGDLGADIRDTSIRTLSAGRRALPANGVKTWTLPDDGELHLEFLGFASRRPENGMVFFQMQRWRHRRGQGNFTMRLALVRTLEDPRRPGERHAFVYRGDLDAFQRQNVLKSRGDALGKIPLAVYRAAARA